MLRAAVVVLTCLSPLLAMAATCPIPEIVLRPAADDEPFDAAATVAVLEGLRTAAGADAARVQNGAAPLGGELSALALGHALISAEAVRLAVRLRQLDCAVLRGVTADHGLYGAIAADAQAAAAHLAALVPAHPRQSTLTPVQRRRKARGERIGGGVLLAVAAVALGGAIYTTTEAVRLANTPKEPRCNGEPLCFNDLGNGLLDFARTVTAVGAGGLFAIAISTAAGGGRLVRDGARESRAAGGAALSWSASPHGGAAGLALTF